ncbi:MAG: NAD-dependent epimerase/dehydratase family protein [Syntrophales bacterium]|nr:NAD-dependent epimerase/dehydratase family protein [Syntrophales bacterium]
MTNFLKGKNVLVTGGSGFVGTNLITRLLELGANVTGTYNKNLPQVQTDIIRWCKVDLTDKESCHFVTLDQDYVFMCAANTSGAAVMENTPLVHVTPNVIMNSLMLEQAYVNKVKKFIFLSSNCVYPYADFPLAEEHCTGEFFHKYFFVANMKRFSEILCQMYSEKIKNPMTCIVVRPSNIYGPYDDFEWETSHSTPALIRKVIERQDPIIVWGDGNAQKDLIYISDFIDGLISVTEKVNNFDIINLASGKSYSIKETLNIILKTEHYDEANIIFDETKPTMIPKRLISIEKAKRELNFNPKISLSEGILETIKWYRDKCGL